MIQIYFLLFPATLHNHWHHCWWLGKGLSFINIEINYYIIYNEKCFNMRFMNSIL